MKQQIIQNIKDTFYNEALPPDRYPCHRKTEKSIDKYHEDKLGRL